MAHLAIITFWKGCALCS